MQHGLAVTRAVAVAVASLVFAGCSSKPLKTNPAPELASPPPAPGPMPVTVVLNEVAQGAIQDESSASDENYVMVVATNGTQTRYPAVAPGYWSQKKNSRVRPDLTLLTTTMAPDDSVNVALTYMEDDQGVTTVLAKAALAVIAAVFASNGDTTAANVTLTTAQVLKENGDDVKGVLALKLRTRGGVLSVCANSEGGSGAGIDRSDNTQVFPGSVSTVFHNRRRGRAGWNTATTVTVKVRGQIYDFASHTNCSK